MNYIINGTNTKSRQEHTPYDIIQVDSIPMCNSCLIEIKEGKYVCKECQVNLCQYHLSFHKDHKLIELKLIEKI